MLDAYIYDGIRTPFGRHAGALAAVRPDDLLAGTLATLMARSSFRGEDVEDVIVGCANQAGEDCRNVARRAGLLAGLPVEVAGMTVNRLCASGLAAVVDASRAIALGHPLGASGVRGEGGLGRAGPGDGAGTETRRDGRRDGDTAARVPGPLRRSSRCASRVSAPGPLRWRVWCRRRRPASSPESWDWGRCRPQTRRWRPGRVPGDRPRPSAGCLGCPSGLDGDTRNGARAATRSSRCASGWARGSRRSWSGSASAAPQPGFSHSPATRGLDIFGGRRQLDSTVMMCRPLENVWSAPRRHG